MSVDAGRPHPGHRMALGRGFSFFHSSRPNNLMPDIDSQESKALALAHDRQEGGQ